MSGPTAAYTTARSATALTLLSILSPIAGLTVEVALAWQFGASATVDAFRIGAFALVFGQQIFVNQILPHVVLPVFARHRAEGDVREGWRVCLSLANLLLVPTGVAAFALFLWPEPVATILAPGLTGEARETASLFLRWFGLTYVPLMWSGIAAGILNEHRIFWLPAASQLIGNLVLVGLILACGRTLGAASLVIGVMLAAILRALLHVVRLLPLAHRAGVRLRTGFAFAHHGVRRAIKVALPLLGTILLVHWGDLVINNALSHLPTGSLATYGYAWKLNQLASLIPLTLGTIWFTQYAEAWHSGSTVAFQDVCTRSLRMGVFAVLPLTAIFWALRRPIVSLLLQRGALSADAADTVAELAGWLLAGAPAWVFWDYTRRMFYALQETWVPTVVQLAVAVLLTWFVPVAAHASGATGVAAAGALVAWGAAVALVAILSARHYSVRVGELFAFTTVTAMAAAVTALLGWAVFGRFEALVRGQEAWSAIGLTAGVTLSIGGFLFVTRLFRIVEAAHLFAYARWQGTAAIRTMSTIFDTRG